MRIDDRKAHNVTPGQRPSDDKLVPPYETAAQLSERTSVTAVSSMTEVWTDYEGHSLHSCSFVTYDTVVTCRSHLYPVFPSSTNSCLLLTYL